MTNTVDDTSAAEAKVAENVVNTVSLQDRQDAFEAARAEAYKAARAEAYKAARAEAGTRNEILDHDALRYGSYFEYQKHLRMEFMDERYACGSMDSDGKGTTCQP